MPPKARPGSNLSPEPHKWTNFELRALLCLLVRNVHKTGLDSTELERLGSSTAPRHQHRNLPRSGNSPKNSGRLAYVDVATALNDCCHKFDYENDIPVRDVIDMVDKMLLDNKGAVCYSERQPVGRLTRSANRVWKRKINYDGSNAEWEAGRKQKEEIKRREDEERRLNTGAGGGIAGADLDGIATGWGDAEDPPDAGWGTGDQALDKQPSSNEKVAAWGMSMEVDGPIASVEVDDAWGTGEAVPPIGGKAAMINELDVWGLGTGTDVAVPSNVMDSWGAGGGAGLVASKSATNVGEEQGTSQVATVAAPAAATADWGAPEDPFAAPLPPTRLNAWDVAPNAAANKKQDPPISSADNGWGAFESTSAPVTTGRNDNQWDAAPSVPAPLPVTDWGMGSEDTVMAEASLINPSNPSATVVESSINKTAELSTSDWDSQVIEPTNTVLSSNGWGNSNPTKNTTTTAEVIADDSWGTAPASTAVATGNTEAQLKASTADWGDSFVDTSASAPSPTASWGNVIEGIASSNITQLSATASNPLNPADLASAPGINPERLAMLSTTGVNNGEEESADSTFNQDQWNPGQKLSINRDAFASKDNAIPLKYNRLMGQRPDASAGGEQKENEVEPVLTNSKLRKDLDAAQNAEGNNDVDLMDYY
jgi:hypothetical protein